MTTRKMDLSEETAKQYLEQLGLGTVVFEPDGNTCPDFVVGGRIAVEVRRLNQNESVSTGKFRGLEETSYPLGAMVSGVLRSFGPGKSGHSWFIGYDFNRPLPQLGELRSELRRALEPYMDNPRNETGTVIRVGDSLEVKLLHRVNQVHPTFFLLGSSSDEDSGGWVLAEMQKNLRICIEEKTPKMQAVRHKYPEWWLVLLDRIGWGMDAADRQLYNEQMKVQHSWDKVIIVNPLDPKCAFEIPRTA